eukprot:scaffold172186_cov19-Tisochrysis_lutea.AAC.1
MLLKENCSWQPAASLTSAFHIGRSPPSYQGWHRKLHKKSSNNRARMGSCAHATAIIECQPMQH